MSLLTTFTAISNDTLLVVFLKCACPIAMQRSGARFPKNTHTLDKMCHIDLIDPSHKDILKKSVLLCSFCDSKRAFLSLM